MQYNMKADPQPTDWQNKKPLNDRILSASRSDQEVQCWQCQQTHHVKQISPSLARGHESIVGKGHHLVGVQIIRVCDEHQDFALHTKHQVSEQHLLIAGTNDGLLDNPC